jgi:thiosulfate/3-mercaptopyruvate sulfurtransferase
MSLVETSWLEKNLDNVKIIDCSWHMPQTKRDGFNEYRNQHIKNSIFFDLDINSKKNTNLPHMLVDKDEWEKIVSEMGISKNDKIIIYDNSDVISSCRCWFNFIYFGHDPKLVSILNGGLQKWIKEKREVTNEITDLKKTNYISSENRILVKTKETIDKNIKIQKFKVIDARSRERFEGKVPEPRKGLRSGSIKNSFCLPFNLCLNKDKTFKNKEELENVFKSCLKNISDQDIVFSCGSGVTACVLALAYSLINDKYQPSIYDGSWAEYGLI